MRVEDIRDASLTRACLELRRRALAGLTLERLRAMLCEVYSAGPAPRNPQSAPHRRAGSYRAPGRGAYTRQRLRIKGGDEDLPTNRKQGPDQPTNLNRHAGQVLRPATWMECPLSISGHDGGDRDGRCTWCGRQVNAPVARPELGHGYRTELDLAYRYHHDPDYGDDPHDI